MADMKVAKGTQCQEVSSLSFMCYIPCMRQAMYIVKGRDRYAYPMCNICANYNVRNRGAHIVQEGEAVKIFLLLPAFAPR